MDKYSDLAICHTYKLIVRLCLAIVVASQLTTQQCDPNGIKAFPRVLGGVSSIHPTTSNQMDTNEEYQ
jgi:hypothetical protein